MTNTALNRTTLLQLRNKSGSTQLQGSVVVVDTGTEKSFDTTTTEAYSSTQIGVVIEPAGILNDEIGSVALAGWVPKINLDSSASVGSYITTATVAGQGTPSATSVIGAFAETLESGTTPEAFLTGSVVSSVGYIADNTYTEYDAVSGDKTIFEETIPAMPSGIIRSHSWGTLVNNTANPHNITIKLVLDAETITGPTISVPGGASDARNWTLDTILTDSAATFPGAPIVALLTFIMQIDGDSDPTTTFIASYYDLFTGSPNTTHTYKAQINLATTDFTMERYATVIEGPYTA